MHSADSDKHMSAWVGGRKRRRLALAATAIAAFAISAFAAVPFASGAVVYDNIATPQPGNVPSEAFEATSTSEWGGQVQLAGTERKEPKVTVLMSSWGCQNGGNATCQTAPGATFTHTITLNLYAVQPDQSPGALLASKTGVFAIPYRPSADLVHCSGGPWYDAASGNCYNGYATPISFNFAGDGVTLPDNVIVTVVYNTSNHGYAPMGAQPCQTQSGGCGYDSLNVGAQTAGPVVGSIPSDLIDDTYAASSWGGAYCDNTPSDSLRLDDCTPGNGWADYQPSFRISAFATDEGPVGPAGPTGATGATGPAGKSSSSGSIALKRKMAISFSRSSVSVSRTGTVAIPVRCTGSVASHCVGTLALRALGTAQSATYVIPKGKRAKVRIHLRARLRRRMLSAGGAGVKARAIARTEQPAGAGGLFKSFHRLRLS